MVRRNSVWIGRQPVPAGHSDPSQKIFVLKVMTHEIYDEDKWKEEWFIVK